MRPKLSDIWFLRRLPARLNRDETGALLGFSYEDVCHLVAHRVLKPIAYKAGCQDWFATVEIEEFARDPKWLSQATKIVREAVQAKNNRQKKNAAVHSENEQD